MRRSSDKQQQQITALFSERVKKPRSSPADSLHAVKRQKVTDQLAIAKAPIIPPAPSVVSKNKKLNETPPAPTKPATPSAPPPLKAPVVPVSLTDSTTPVASKLVPAKRKLDGDSIAPPLPTSQPVPQLVPTKRKLGEISEDSTKPNADTQPESPSSAKRPKVDDGSALSVPPAAVSEASNKPVDVQAQKRKWRLAEIVRKDREARRFNTSNEPSFVFIPTARAVSDPKASSSICSGDQKTAITKNTTTSVGPAQAVACTMDKVSLATHISSTSVPGADALLHDRDMLPKSYALLLDVLTSMESALGLLRTRRTPSTVAAVRGIVQRDTRRDFTVRSLSQLACIVPECVAVLEPTFKRRTPRSKVKFSDTWVIRLDDPDVPIRSKAPVFSPRTSMLGDGPARLRRALLHKRLLEKVRNHHDEFICTRDQAKPQGAVWHPEFDPNRDVPALPAPPLFSERPSQPARQVRGLAELDSPTTESVTKTMAQSMPSSTTSPTVIKKARHNKNEKDDENDDFIPKSLLDRVRSREKAKEARTEKADEDRASNRSLLSKLPCTMDSINTVMRTERRSAMGWRQLVNKVATLHPRKWPSDDIERQMNAITKLATEWCTKVELKSSRGGFAFRVVSDKGFAAARARVIGTESFSME